MFPSRRITTTGGDVFRDEFSLAFDGTNDNIRISDVTVDTDGACAIVFWAKYAGGGSSPWCVLGNTSDSNSKHLRFVGTDDLKWENDTNDEESVINLPIAFTDQQWHHYVVVSNSGTVTAYQDGVACTIAGDNLSSSNCTFNSIGGQGTNGVVYGYKGNISEIAIYNKALSASEAKTLYNGREPYNHKEGVCSSNLQAWWRMGDGVLDSKQNSHANTGIVSDETNPTLGSDLLGGKGDFSDASYWTITSGQSIVEDNVGKFLGNGSFGQIKRNSLLTVGKMYRCQLDCTSNTGTTISLNQESPYPQVAPISGTGTFFCFFKAHVTHFTLFAPTNSYGEAAIIDNVILQEVNGNAGAIININTTNCFEGDTP